MNKSNQFDNNPIDQSEKKLTANDLPNERAAYYLDRAKRIALIGSSTSIELERIIKEANKALKYKNNDPLLFTFLSKIFRVALDISSAIFFIRQALQYETNQNSHLIKQLSELLKLKGKELMIEAVHNNDESVISYRKALNCFEESLQYDHEDISIWVYKAVCHIHMKEFMEAYKTVNRVMKPSKFIPAELYILRAKILLARGLIEQGNLDIRIAASIAPQHPEVIAYSMRSYELSETLYQSSIQAFIEKKYEHALTSITHALHLTPEDVKLHIMASKIMRMMGNLQASYSAIMKAKDAFYSNMDDSFKLPLPVDISRQISLILNDMAIKYATDGDYDRAILLLNKIINSEKVLNNDIVVIDYKYYVNRGDCYRAMHQLSHAIVDYEKALELEPNQWDIKTKMSLTYYLLATDSFNKMNYNECKQHLDAAIHHNEKVAQYYLLRGKACYYCIDYQQSYQNFKKAFELDPENKEIAVRLRQFESELPDVVGGGSPKVNKNVSIGWSEESMGLMNNKGKEINSLNMIETLLHAKEVRKLPALKLLKDRDGTLESSLPPSRGGIQRIGHLPSYYDKAIAAKSKIELNKQNVFEQYNMKIDYGKGGGLWDVIQDAGTMLKPKPPTAAEQERQYKNHLMGGSIEVMTPRNGTSKSAPSTMQKPANESILIESVTKSSSQLISDRRKDSFISLNSTSTQSKTNSMGSYITSVNKSTHLQSTSVKKKLMQKLILGTPTNDNHIKDSR